MTTSHTHTSMTPLDIVKWLLSRNIRQVMLMVVLMVAVAPLGATAKPGNNGGPGNSGAAKQCQKGGWQELARADNPAVAFTNQGACVSYGANGGIVVPLDSDLDGSPDVSDCAPYNPAVSPLLPEVPDGIDNNCNGQVDEGRARLQIEWQEKSDTIGCRIVVNGIGFPLSETVWLELQLSAIVNEHQWSTNWDGAFRYSLIYDQSPGYFGIKVYTDSTKSELLAEASAGVCG